MLAPCTAFVCLLWWTCQEKWRLTRAQKYCHGTCSWLVSSSICWIGTCLCDQRLWLCSSYSQNKLCPTMMRHGHQHETELNVPVVSRPLITFSEPRWQAIGMFRICCRLFRGCTHFRKILYWIVCFPAACPEVIKMISTCSVFADNALVLLRLVKFVSWERKIVMDNRYFETLCSNGNLVVYGDALVDLNVLHKLLKGFSSEDGPSSVKSMQQASSKYAGKKKASSMGADLSTGLCIKPQDLENSSPDLVL